MASRPKIRLHVPRRARPVEVPGIGDKALLRIEKTTDGDDAVAYQGRAIKIIDRAKHRVLGVFRKLGDGGRLVPIDKKNLGRELSIPAAAVNGARGRRSRRRRSQHAAAGSACRAPG